MSEELEKRIGELETEKKILKSAAEQWDHIQRMFLESYEKLRNSEGMLKELKERMERALTAGDLAWWDWEYKTGTLYYNPERARLLGYSPEELPKNFHEFEKQIHPDDLDAAVQGIRSHISGETPCYEAEYRLKNNSGEWKWFYDRGKVVEKDILGNPVLISGVLIDINDRKLAEQELTEARDLADATSRAKSLFLANMSHEIYTPMAGVVGMADILQQSALTQEQREYLDIIVNSASNLMSILNDIMEFIKVENQKIELSRSPVSITQIIQEITVKTIEKCRQKNLELLTFIDTHIPDHVMGDPKRLRQLLQIFINNAVKFTDEGRIIISAEFAEWDEDSIRIRFRIADTGIGIPRQEQGRLFQSFTRVNTKVGKYGGSGLGLAIAHHLVKLMNGSIEVESEEGKGSTFTFTVELDRLVEQETHLDTGAVKGKRILLVDRDPVRRSVLRDYLLIWDCEVEEKETVQDGLEAARQQIGIEKPFDLIFIDHTVFGNEMIALDESFRGSEWQKSPLILVTDHSETVPEQLVEKAGFRAMLRRPFLPEQLLSAMKLLLSGKQEAFSTIGDFDRQELIDSEKKLLQILLAEDNLINQKVALVTLSKLGHQTHLAENGKKAVELFKENRYDLVLLDIFMPEMDGLEAARIMREIESERGSEPVHICAITANVHKEDEDKCYEAGMNSYITKPFKLEELNAVLSEL
ncbi:MAG: response regulator [Bacteroidota bacterium]